MAIKRPENFDTTAYYNAYMTAARGDDALQELYNSKIETINFIDGLNDEDLAKCYAARKWTIAQVLMHIIDAERVFAYRAMRLLRGDATPLPGFDEDLYAEASLNQKLDKSELLGYYIATRLSTLALFKNLNEKNLDFEGIVNKQKFTPRLLAWLVVGHNLHHLEVLKTRYF